MLQQGTHVVCKEYACQLGKLRQSFSVQFFFSKPASPQSITGTILGTVYDSSGSVVPNAKVVATNAAQGWARETTSDGLGNYIFNQLPPGPYKVNVTATGFQSLSVAPFELLGRSARAGRCVSYSPARSPNKSTSRLRRPYWNQIRTPSARSSIHATFGGLPLNGRRFFDLALLIGRRCTPRHHILLGSLGVESPCVPRWHPRH